MRTHTAAVVSRPGLPRWNPGSQNHAGRTIVVSLREEMCREKTRHFGFATLHHVLPRFQATGPAAVSVQATSVLLEN